MPAKTLEHVLHFTSTVSLAESDGMSDIECLRVGVLQDRGLEITPGMLSDFVQHWKENVYGTPLQVNIGHNREGEAAGWIKNLFVDGDSLMAKVEWTELGRDKITKKLYQFVSSELALDYPHCDTGQPVSNVFIGAALTNVPALKHQEPVALSEEEKAKLTIKRTAMLKQLIAELNGREKVSAADMAFLRKLLSEATPEEQEAAKAEAEALEKKAAEEAEAAKKAEEEAAAAAAAGAGTEATTEKAQTVSLAEHNALKERLDRKELAETVQKTLVLSEAVQNGFREADVPAVVDFVVGLSEAQRAAFATLMGKVAHVDLTVRGSTHVQSATEAGTQEEKTVALAEKLLKEGKAKDIREAQKMAEQELGNK